MLIKNLDTESLMAYASIREESFLTKDDVLCTYTGDCTGRSPHAKKIVFDKLTADKVCWQNNTKISQEEFDSYYERFSDYLAELKESENQHLYLQEVSAVRDPSYKLDLNVWTAYAKHSLFSRNMFVPKDNKHNFDAVYDVYHFPDLCEEPTVLISFVRRVILISGTLYSGEIKKSVFTVLNYWFPEDHDFLPMHCSVNIDKERENPAIFFGLSGTGKTTLSSDPNRILIGDDEHGWTDKGLVNFEGGGYAKTIRLSRENEPQIWDACFSPGTMLENVVIKDGVPDFDDATYTENARASYSTEKIQNSDALGYVNEHPKNIIMLTCDSFGVLPPVAKLTAEEAVEQFLLGYTSKVAGTEAGITEPVATFSPCFGLPFMPLPAKRYGDLLQQKIECHDVDCWLVNTGWTGGGYGVGDRIPIKITRSIIDGILDGSFADARTFVHIYTGFTVPDIPSSVIPMEVLHPEIGWGSNADYASAAGELMNLFKRARNEIIN